MQDLHQAQELLQEDFPAKTSALLANALVLLAQEAGRAKRIQIMQDGNKIWYVGIPAKGDMAALEAACQAQGVVFSQVSWRS